MSYTKEQRIVNQMSGKTGVPTEESQFIIPNHSGIAVHPEFKKSVSANETDPIFSTWLITPTSFADNVELLFGTGSDASIKYDGTNFVINPKKVGTGYVSIAGNINGGTNTLYYVNHKGSNFGTLAWQNSDTTINTQANYDIVFKEGTTTLGVADTTSGWNFQGYNFTTTGIGTFGNLIANYSDLTRTVKYPGDFNPSTTDVFSIKTNQKESGEIYAERLRSTWTSGASTSRTDVMFNWHHDTYKPLAGYFYFYDTDGTSMDVRIAGYGDSASKVGIEVSDYLGNTNTINPTEVTFNNIYGTTYYASGFNFIDSNKYIYSPQFHFADEYGDYATMYYDSYNSYVSLNNVLSTDYGYKVYGTTVIDDYRAFTGTDYNIDDGGSSYYVIHHDGTGVQLLGYQVIDSGGSYPLATFDGSSKWDMPNIGEATISNLITGKTTSGSTYQATIGDDTNSKAGHFTNGANDVTIVDGNNYGITFGSGWASVMNWGGAVTLQYDNALGATASYINSPWGADGYYLYNSGSGLQFIDASGNMPNVATITASTFTDGTATLTTGLLTGIAGINSGTSADVVMGDGSLTTGISATITTAALTGGGSQGSMTFTNGVLTAQTQAT